MFLQFNCFLLMPVIDKLPALLQEDLDSVFEDDLDNVFDITNLQHSLGQKKRDTEIELKRVSTSFAVSREEGKRQNKIELQMKHLVLFNHLTCSSICRLRGLERSSG